MPQPKSGCTGAIFPSSRHELKAWQTGGVHVRPFVATPVAVPYGSFAAVSVSTSAGDDRLLMLHCRHWCRIAGRHCGSASDSRVSDFTAGKPTPKLTGRIADVRGRQ